MSPADAPEKNRGRLSDVDRLFIITLVIGVLIGLVLSFLVAYGLLAFGYLSIGQPVCPRAEGICPPTLQVAPPVCPTCEVIFVTVPPSTETPSPTPDIGATATAACAAFRQQFPGTPCP